MTAQNKPLLAYHTCHDTRQDCFFSGYKIPETYAINAFKNEVREKLFDTQGTQELVDSIQSTDFDFTTIKKMLSLEEQSYLAKDWRIGEEFSEYFFEKELGAFIPYNSVRDAKNPAANATGTDIVGFIQSDAGTKFLFVEVKTSNHQQSPPSTAYSMTKQIEELIDPHSVPSKNLVRYLGLKAKSEGFHDKWREALSNFLKQRYVVYGSLVRDTICTEGDLKTRFVAIMTSLSPTLVAGMIALYLPIKMEEWQKIVAAGGADGH